MLDQQRRPPAASERELELVHSIDHIGSIRRLTGALMDLGSGAGRGHTINVPVAPGTEEEVWISVLEHVIVPVGLEFAPELVLISAGFDARREGGVDY